MNTSYEQFDVLRFWSRDQLFPTIKQLIPKILCIPASSANAERVYSCVGRQLTSKRANLSKNKVRKVSYISINAPLFSS